MKTRATCSRGGATKQVFAPFPGGVDKSAFSRPVARHAWAARSENTPRSRAGRRRGAVGVAAGGGAIAAALVVTTLGPASLQAMDKQGSAHAGHAGQTSTETSDETAFAVSGTLSAGTALLNKRYAARPDNTGLALFRYAAHADIDLLGRRLSVPLDVNLFTDRTHPRAARFFVPSEIDLIGGVTSTYPWARGALELGARIEHDRSADRGGFTQTYVDVRARYIYSLAAFWPGLRRELVDGDVSGYATVGWFALNPTYAAMPDNTGLALFRYVVHSELSVWHDRLAIGLDTTFFTDRQEANPVRPTELDATYEIIVRHAPFEVHVAYERDMPLHRRAATPAYVQDYVFALGVFAFDFRPGPHEPTQAAPTP